MRLQSTNRMGTAIEIHALHAFHSRDRDRFRRSRHERTDHNHIPFSSPTRGTAADTIKHNERQSPFFSTKWETHVVVVTTTVRVQRPCYLKDAKPLLLDPQHPLPVCSFALNSLLEENDNQDTAIDGKKEAGVIPYRDYSSNSQ